jgi:hypothetical protein
LAGPPNGKDVMARWSVDLIRKRMERFGTVVAANEAAATKMRRRFFVAPGMPFT